MTARFALKAATDDLHRELDQRMARLDLADRTDYATFLRIQARAVPPVEDALAAAGLGEVVPDWPATRRSAALPADLSALGEPMPAPAPQPPLGGTAAMLGAAYVLEGSRLGARVLKPQVGVGLPTQFLDSDGALGAWPALVAAMDRLLYSDALVGGAEDAARACFALFLTVACEAGL